MQPQNFFTANKKQYMVIDDMLPLSAVESSAFRKLVTELLPCPVHLPDRKTLSSHIEQAYESMMRKIKDTLEGVDNVSSTADVWMAHHRSYLGMTAHWIDQTSLKRQKAAIACMYIVGCHTNDVLAAKIEEVHRKFGLHGKISATVTDNGSNFVKAFTTFAVREESGFNEEQSILDDDEALIDDDVTFMDVHDMMILDENNTDDLTQVEYELPLHQQCAAHTYVL